MVRRTLCFMMATALLVGGLLGAYFLLFDAERIPLALLYGAGFFAVVGAAWLWVDFVMPIWRKGGDDAERA